MKRSGRSGRNRQGNNWSSGFTLVEILVALVAAVLIIGVILGIYQSVSRTMQSTIGGPCTLSKAASVLDIIRRDLVSAAYLPISESGQFILDRGPDTENASSSIAFYMLSVASVEEGMMQSLAATRISYRIEWNRDQGQETGSLVREVRKLTSDGIADTSEGDTLVKGIEQLKFMAFDGEEWQESWQDESSRMLPKAVQIKLVFKTGSDRIHELKTEVLIRAGTVF